MTDNDKKHRSLNGHRIVTLMILCLFGLCVVQSMTPARKRKTGPKDDRVYLVHSDVLRYDMYGANPRAQIAKGHVHFRHQGAQLWCDSAYFYEESNSFDAFGHVRFKQGDTLSLTCNTAKYNGTDQLLVASKNVVLKHHRQTLYTDSLTYDRLYKNAYFVEGGKLVDGKDNLVSDWGEYNTETRQAVFYYDVKLYNGNRLITTDTLYYDNATSVAHIVGPSTITQDESVIETEDGFFDTKTDKAQMYKRSTVVDKQKSITGDSLFYDDKTGQSEGFGDVIYIDKENKNELHCGHLKYNEQTGYGFATGRALAIDYSQKDTLYLHGDSMKIYTYHINTDSVYREVHCFDKVRAYRVDVQAVCDSLVYNSKDSCITMYRDPIVWNQDRQLLGEVIKVYMQDTIVRMAHIIGQALSVERLDDKDHYNQISSKEMKSFFTDGKIRHVVSYGNVLMIYYPIDEADTTMIGLNYTETDTMKMYLSEQRKLEKIWMPKAVGTLYPMTQIPPGKMRLKQFAWFEHVRPVDKDDIFNWRGKGAGAELKVIERHAAPLQTFDSAVVPGKEEKLAEDELEEQKTQEEQTEEEQVTQEE